MLLAFEMRLLLCLDLYTMRSGRFRIIRLVLNPIYSMQAKKGYSCVCGYCVGLCGKKEKFAG